MTITEQILNIDVVRCIDSNHAALLDGLLRARCGVIDFERYNGAEYDFETLGFGGLEVV